MQRSATVSGMRIDAIGILIDGFIGPECRRALASLTRKNCDP
jgi:hypothetical protein